MRAGERSAVVTLPRAYVPTPLEISTERLPGPLMTLGLIVVLPLFAQSFYYLNELTVSYLLSKAWPILTAPLALYALISLRLPGKIFYLLFLAYALGMTPLISMVHLGNGVFDGVLTTVKVWPLTYYFGLSALLVLLSPSYERTKTVLIGLGVTTFVLMVVLWVLVPTSWYGNNPELGKLFMVEDERGYRIYMPMFFGALLLFFLTRSFMQRPRLLPLLAIVAGFVLMIMIFKQRTSIGAMFLVCVYGAAMSLQPRPRLAVLALLAVIAPLGLVFLVVFNAQDLTQSLGGSLTVRQTSVELAANFLGDNPWRWLFGVGATTRFGTVTLADIFGNSQFYVADLGWFGVVFEYGLFGAVLLAGLYAWGLFVVLRRVRTTNDPLLLALSDYIVFMLVTSAVYSLVFTPGELGVVMALAIHLSQARERVPAAEWPPHRIVSSRPDARPTTFSRT